MSGSTPLHVWDEGDRVGERVAVISLVTSALATRRDLARGLGCHENTVQRLVRGGLEAVLPVKPGPKRKSKVTPAVLERIEEGRRQGMRGGEILRWLAPEHGIEVSRASVFVALQQRSRDRTEQLSWEAAAVTGPIDATVSGDTAAVARAATDVAERTVANVEPPVVLPHAEHGRYMGLTLYYPALAAIGLLPATLNTLRLRWAERMGCALWCSPFSSSACCARPRSSRPRTCAGWSSAPWWAAGGRRA